jgi:hypothetical protein
MRVRLVFEIEVSNDLGIDQQIEWAAENLEGRLSNTDNTVGDIFKEIKILRKHTKREGVTYGRPKKNGV